MLASMFSRRLPFTAHTATHMAMCAPQNKPSKLGVQSRLDIACCSGYLIVKQPSIDMREATLGNLSFGQSVCFVIRSSSGSCLFLVFSLLSPTRSLFASHSSLRVQAHNTIGTIRCVKSGATYCSRLSANRHSSSPALASAAAAFCKSDD